MGIAEINNKTSLIKSNVPKVYEAGQNAGGGADYDEAYDEGYQAGYTDGQESVPNHLYYAKKTNAIYTGSVFPENFEFMARIKECTDYGYMFNNCRNLKSVKIISETQDTVLDMTAFCSIASNGTPTLELVDFTEFNKKFDDIFNLFQYQKKLKTVLGEIDLSPCTRTTNAFRENQALEEIRFKAGTIPISIHFSASPLLSATSIQSIIDGLATVETAQTLTLHKNIVLTDEQKATISSKGWTLAQ